MPEKVLPFVGFAAVISNKAGDALLKFWPILVGAVLVAVSYGALETQVDNVKTTTVEIKAAQITIAADLTANAADHARFAERLEAIKDMMNKTAAELTAQREKLDRTQHSGT